MGKGLSFVLVLVFLIASVLAVKPASNASLITNSWVEKSSPMPSEDWNDEAAVVNGTIYLMGVLLPDMSSNNYAYNPGTGSWTKIAPMPTPRISFSITAYGDKIYVIGGLEVSASFHDDVSQVSCSVNEVYNPANDTWATAASMPTATALAQANTVNGKIYVMGGETGQAGSTLNITQIFDPTTDSWSIGASIPHADVDVSSAVIDGGIYLMSASSFTTLYNQIYNTTTDAWSLGSPMPAPAGGAGATTGVNSPKRIYVFDGVVGFGVVSNQTYAYNPTSNLWTTEALMPDAIWYPTVAVVNDVFYVFGDVSALGAGAVVVEQYTPVGYGSPDPSYVLEHYPANITVLSPLNRTYNDSAVPLNFTVNKPLTWASYSLDGGQNVTVAGNDTLSNLTNGLHSVTVYANDTYGNIGASETVNFTVAVPESPAFSTTAIAGISGASLVALGAGIAVYVKKQKR
jgi:hypothetical protein